MVPSFHLPAAPRAVGVRGVGGNGRAASGPKRPALGPGRRHGTCYQLSNYDRFTPPGRATYFRAPRDGERHQRGRRNMADRTADRTPVRAEDVFQVGTRVSWAAILAGAAVALAVHVVLTLL